MPHVEMARYAGAGHQGTTESDGAAGYAGTAEAGRAGQVLTQMRVRKSMKELETTLAPYDFIRIHKGYLVNCAYIARIDNDVTPTTGEHLMLSRRSAEEVRLAYMDYIEKNAGPLI